jgi:hypothetical protein
MVCCPAVRSAFARRRARFTWEQVVEARRLLASAAYGPEAVKLLGEAFDLAWGEVENAFTTPLAREAARRRSTHQCGGASGRKYCLRSVGVRQRLARNLAASTSAWEVCHTCHRRAARSSDAVAKAERRPLRISWNYSSGVRSPTHHRAAKTATSSRPRICSRGTAQTNMAGCFGSRSR